MRSDKPHQPAPQALAVWCRDSHTRPPAWKARKVITLIKIHTVQHERRKGRQGRSPRACSPSLLRHQRQDLGESDTTVDSHSPSGKLKPWYPLRQSGQWYLTAQNNFLETSKAPRSNEPHFWELHGIVTDDTTQETDPSDSCLSHFLAHLDYCWSNYSSIIKYPFKMNNPLTEFMSKWQQERGQEEICGSRKHLVVAGHVAYHEQQQQQYKLFWEHLFAREKS